MTKNWGSTRKLYVSAYLQCLFRTFSTYATHISIRFLHTAPLVCDLVEPCGTVSPSHRIIVCDRVTHVTRHSFVHANALFSLPGRDPAQRRPPRGHPRLPRQHANGGGVGRAGPGEVRADRRR